MKTSLDFPDPLFRQLKAQAALQGSSIKNLLGIALPRDGSPPTMDDYHAYLEHKHLGSGNP